MSKEANRIWTPHKLIIAEKPSVARTIAEVLGVTQTDNPKHIRYLFNDEWIISWCIGHLVELAMPQDYDKRYEKWRGEDLPILPQPWKYTVTKKTKDQFEMLSFMLTHEKVTEVVCATDAGREGELIFRLVYHQCGSDKPVKRLWISSLEESVIRDGMNHLRDSSDFDLLYEAALWGNANGYKTLLLGGGVGSKDDGVLLFKKSFYRGNLNRFHIGRKIFDNDKYNELSNLRCVIPESEFFPKYRA